MSLVEKRPLSIAISCYPTYGGSGVLATELGLEMARRGHRVHFISYEVPRRLTGFAENVFFHEVEVSTYPLFSSPPWALALASKMIEVCDYEGIDILHVHYAIPHATSAYLARQVLKERAPKIVTTLHGTDITLVGTDRSYLPITRFTIAESDAVTAVSHYLKRATYDKLNVSTRIPIEVIYNFVDTEEYSPDSAAPCRLQKMLRCRDGATLPFLCHVSNFRPVKRVDDVLDVFLKVRAEVPCRLVLVGDGPERSRLEQRTVDLGVHEEVCFLGKQDVLAPILSACEIFLLPSQTESFGLAALEAMACGKPVIASRVGGIPELVIDGENGFLADMGDVSLMASRAVQLLKDSALRARFGAAARATATQQFSRANVVGQYESLYYRVLSGDLSGGDS